MIFTFRVGETSTTLNIIKNGIYKTFKFEEKWVYKLSKWSALLPIVLPMAKQGKIAMKLFCKLKGIRSLY